MSTLNFCTLFDSNYLARGLALHRSLLAVCPSFHLYVFAFDDQCYRYLQQNPLPHLTPISLVQFENPDLLNVKGSRSVAEYCWTCTPFTILFCLQTYDLPSCTYLDADMIFYHDPAVLLEEMGEKSVLISEHRYSMLYDQSWYSGVYCVQFMCFKNNADGLHVLHWWKDRCLEWCYAKLEDGKFGDQKYLDDWTTRFNTVHVLQHTGGGLAPWNIREYQINAGEEGIMLSRKLHDKKYRLIFFHFHGIKFFNGEKVLLAGPLYYIQPQALKLLYYPYIKTLFDIARVITEQYPEINANGAAHNAPGIKKLLVRFVTQHLNAFPRYLPGVFHLKNYNFSYHNHLYHIKDLY